MWLAVKIGQARDDVYTDDCDTPSMVSSYRCGLAQRLVDITSVVHMATYCDYSIQPDIGKMQRINVEGRSKAHVRADICMRTELRDLLELCCATTSVRRVILVSSAWVHVAAGEPCVNVSEACTLPLPTNLLLADYARTMRDAEMLINSYSGTHMPVVHNLHYSTDRLQVCIARVTELYGEYDEQSIVAQLAMFAAQRHGRCPLIGDRGGVLQVECSIGMAADAHATRADDIRW